MLWLLRFYSHTVEGSIQRSCLLVERAFLRFAGDVERHE